MTGWIETLRNAVRPLMLVMLALIIGPLALITGLLEAFVPGAGLRFASGFMEYMRGLPDSFWAFAGTSYGIYTAARSFGHDKRAAMPDGPLSGSGRVDNPDNFEVTTT